MASRKLVLIEWNPSFKKELNHGWKISLRMPSRLSATVDGVSQGGRLMARIPSVDGMPMPKQERDQRGVAAPRRVVQREIPVIALRHVHWKA